MRGDASSRNDLLSNKSELHYVRHDPSSPFDAGITAYSLDNSCPAGRRRATLSRVLKIRDKKQGNKIREDTFHSAYFVHEEHKNVGERVALLTGPGYCGIPIRQKECRLVQIPWNL